MGESAYGEFAKSVIYMDKMDTQPIYQDYLSKSVEFSCTSLLWRYNLIQI